MLLSKYTKEKNGKKGEDSMLNDEICKLREKLNKSIEDNDTYETIYKLSIELDELIEEYYGIKKKNTEVVGNKLIIY